MAIKLFKRKSKPATISIVLEAGVSILFTKDGAFKSTKHGLVLGPDAGIIIEKNHKPIKDYNIRPHTELHDILCNFVNQNQVAISELKGGDPIPESVNFFRAIDEIISLFAGEFFKAQRGERNAT